MSDEQNRAHLIEHLDRLAVIQHQIDEVATRCLRANQDARAAALFAAEHLIEQAHAIIERELPPAPPTPPPAA